MKDSIFKFLQKNKELLDRPDPLLDELYNNASYESTFTLGELTDEFLNRGKNPLEYMSSVPWNFMRASRYENPLFTIPKGKGIEEIGKMAFMDSRLGGIMIPEGIKVIDSFAFSRCPNLEVVYFPSTIEELGTALFLKSDKIKEIYYNGNYSYFLNNVDITSGEDDKLNWFKLYAGRADSDCILICKDTKIKLGYNK